LLNKRVTRAEKRWIFRFALFVLLITTIPYWVGFAHAGTDWHFTGFVFGVEDGNSYIAKMLSGAAGDWLFRTPYTAIPQSGFLAFMPYILLGKLTAEPGQHEQLVVVYHLFRFAAGLLMLFATYDFIALFIDQAGWRKAGLVMIAVGGGVGWLFLLLFEAGSRLPLEFYSPETFGFLALYGLPHLAMARALLLWGLVVYLLPNLESPRFPLGILGGLLWLLLGFFQPLTVVIGWSVLAAHLLVLGVMRWLRNRETGLHEWDDWLRYFRKAGLIVVISMGVVIYTMFSFWIDPFLQGWGDQNLILSPPPQDYLLAYGLLLPFTILGISPLLKKYPLKGPMLLGWFVMLPFLAYAPYNLQRRLPEGGWVVIVILAIFFLQSWKRNNQRIMAVLLTITFIPALILLAGGIMSAARTAEPIFQPAERVAAYRFLSEYAVPGEVVLAAYTTSNALPAWAPLRVVIGHGPESVGLETLRPRVERFYLAGTNDLERVNLLEEMQVRYIFWGPEEAGLADDPSDAWHPVEATFLRHIYTQGSYQIYEVSEDLSVTP
jgi:hypothetical protein